jgi:hypothetical protein
LEQTFCVRDYGQVQEKTERSLKFTAEIIENTIDVWKLEKASVLSPQI